MFSGFKKVISAAIAVGLVMSASSTAVYAAGTGIQPDGRIVVGPEAARVIGEYLEKVSGRFGALAVSNDGQHAAYYICQSRLWKNCDDYSLEDSYITIPSGRLAADLAEKRCRGFAGGSGGCIVLFVNETWKRQFTLSN